MHTKNQSPRWPGSGLKQGGRRRKEKNYDFKGSLASHLRLWLGLNLTARPSGSEAHLSFHSNCSPMCLASPVVLHTHSCSSHILYCSSQFLDRLVLVTFLLVESSDIRLVFEIVAHYKLCATSSPIANDLSHNLDPNIMVVRVTAVL